MDRDPFAGKGGFSQKQLIIKAFYDLIFIQHGRHFLLLSYSLATEINFKKKPFPFNFFHGFSHMFQLETWLIAFLEEKLFLCITTLFYFGLNP